jgi:hypothetical protein
MSDVILPWAAVGTCLALGVVLGFVLGVLWVRLFVLRQRAVEHAVDETLQLYAGTPVTKTLTAEQLLAVRAQMRRT